MAKDRFDMLENDAVNKPLDSSSAGATSRRFRRWLEFKGEKRSELKLEPEQKKASNPTPTAATPSAPARRTRQNNDKAKVSPRKLRYLRQRELREAQEREQRARNTLVWIFGGLGFVGYSIYMRAQGGFSGNLLEIVLPLIFVVVAIIFRNGRYRRGGWGDD